MQWAQPARSMSNLRATAGIVMLAVLLPPSQPSRMIGYDLRPPTAPPIGTKPGLRFRNHA